jgi:organic radical activating enzyme
MSSIGILTTTSHKMKTPSANHLDSNNQVQPLQINDLFWTVQGEGRWSGRRALFVRLPFCNYDCPWCDTEYNSFKKTPVEDFVSFIKQEPSRFAVITGGEPMAHKDLTRIIMLLKKEGFYIACETNGSLPIPDEIDFPTVSPKRYTQKKFPEYFMHDDARAKAKEFKYVVDDDFDFKILERHNVKFTANNLSANSVVDCNTMVKESSAPTSAESASANNTASPKDEAVRYSNREVRFSLTPEYSTMQKQLPRILKYIQENPKWQLNLQTHKWINIP